MMLSLEKFVQLTFISKVVYIIMTILMKIFWKILFFASEIWLDKKWNEIKFRNQIIKLRKVEKIGELIKKKSTI